MLKRPLLAFALVVLSLLAATAARAEPWFGFGENALEDAYADGDVDEEDVLAMSLGRARTGASDLHGQSWFSVVGAYSELPSGRRDVSAMAVVGVPLDRIAAGPQHRALARVAPTPKAKAQAKEPAAAAFDPRQAHACVAAAFRAYGLGEDDGVIDAMISRSRASAVLPELRLRVSRLVTDAAHSTTSVLTDGTTLYDAVGSNLTLEARMTWRLDRLIFAGDEPSLERLRMARQAARARIAAAVLRSLFQWQRAKLDAKMTAEDTPEREEAELKVTETEAMLDVLTKGWFGQSRRGS